MRRPPYPILAHVRSLNPVAEGPAQPTPRRAHRPLPLLEEPRPCQSASVNKGTSGVLKDGPLKQAADAAFGSLDNPKEFNTATLGIRGRLVGDGFAFFFASLRLIPFVPCFTSHSPFAFSSSFLSLSLSVTTHNMS